MNHHIIELEKNYRELLELYRSLMDAGFYDRHPGQRAKDRERLRAKFTQLSSFGEMSEQ
jgi:hypothetical protein